MSHQSLHLDFLFVHVTCALTADTTAFVTIQILIHLVKRFQGSTLVAEDVSAEPVWKGLLGVVLDKSAGGYSEDLSR